MKRIDRERVRWLLEAFMAEHRASCVHKETCPTEKHYADIQELVEAG